MDVPSLKESFSFAIGTGWGSPGLIRDAELCSSLRSRCTSPSRPCRASMLPKLLSRPRALTNDAMPFVGPAALLLLCPPVGYAAVRLLCVCYRDLLTELQVKLASRAGTRCNTPQRCEEPPKQQHVACQRSWRPLLAQPYGALPTGLHAGACSAVRTALRPRARCTPPGAQLHGTLHPVALQQNDARSRSKPSPARQRPEHRPAAKQESRVRPCRTAPHNGNTSFAPHSCKGLAHAARDQPTAAKYRSPDSSRPAPLS
jgi:hypothetical protein